MLGNPPFYFGTTQKIVNAFGWIFSDIHFIRSDNKVIEVPLEWSAKEKWAQRVESDPNAGDITQRPVSLILPRMGYNMTGFRYDANRKLPTVDYRVGVSNITGNARKQLNPVPIIFDFELYLQTRSLQDSWQIQEQFISFFTPDFNVDILDIPEMNLTRSIKFILKGSEQSDKYEGQYTDKQVREWVFQFEAWGHFYPPVKEKKLITVAHAHVGDLISNIGTAYSTDQEAIKTPVPKIDQPFVIVKS